LGFEMLGSGLGGWSKTYPNRSKPNLIQSKPTPSQSHPKAHPTQTKINPKQTQPIPKQLHFPCDPRD
jgi:hypothetical protein